MPNIVIQEKDETTVQYPNVSTDVVFIPGFADTNRNVYIISGYTAQPDSTLEGEKYEEGSTFQKQIRGGDEQETILKPQFVYNVTTKKTWACDSDTESVLGLLEIGEDPIGIDEADYSWVAINWSEEPLPENSMVVCRTVRQFENNFGKNAYKFVDDEDYPDCEQNAVAAAGDTVMYKKGTEDPSYVMAKEYLLNNLTVVYYNVSVRDDKGKKVNPKVTDIYDDLAGVNRDGSAFLGADGNPVAGSYKFGIMQLLSDKNAVSVKYISTGGYPTFELEGSRVDSATYKDYSKISENLVELAEERGDCIVVLDHFNNPIRALTGDNSLITSVRADKRKPLWSSFATMFTPWSTYRTAKAGVQLLPASYSYLLELAIAIQSFPNYLAVSGTTRGQVTSLIAPNSVYSITNKIANEVYQARDKVSINPVTLINPYGYTIWGNRTLFDNSKKGNLIASSFLNTRNMVSDIKKQAYITAKALMFEQDSDELWLRFKMGVSPLLDNMVNGNGLRTYRIIRLDTKYDGTPLNKGEIAAIIRVFPRYAVEDWEITVVISDEEVTVE